MSCGMCIQRALCLAWRTCTTGIPLGRNSIQPVLCWAAPAYSRHCALKSVSTGRGSFPRVPTAVAKRAAQQARRKAPQNPSPARGP